MGKSQDENKIDFREIKLVEVKEGRTSSIYLIKGDEKIKVISGIVHMNANIGLPAGESPFVLVREGWGRESVYYWNGKELKKIIEAYEIHGTRGLLRGESPFLAVSYQLDHPEDDYDYSHYGRPREPREPIYIDVLYYWNGEELEWVLDNMYKIEIDYGLVSGTSNIVKAVTREKHEREYYYWCGDFNPDREPGYDDSWIKYADELDPLFSSKVEPVGSSGLLTFPENAGFIVTFGKYRDYNGAEYLKYDLIYKNNEGKLTPIFQNKYLIDVYKVDGSKVPNFIKVWDSLNQFTLYLWDGEKPIKVLEEEAGMYETVGASINELEDGLYVIKITVNRKLEKVAWAIIPNGRIKNLKVIEIGKYKANNKGLER